MTAGAADSKISNQPVTFESNRIGSVRFEFESNLEYSQVPSLEPIHVARIKLYPLVSASRTLLRTCIRLRRRVSGVNAALRLRHSLAAVLMCSAGRYQFRQHNARGRKQSENER